MTTPDAVPPLPSRFKSLSIRTKLLALILATLVLACTVIGGAGMLTSRKVITQDSAQIMNLLCLKESQGINSRLDSVSQAVQILATHITANVIDVSLLQRSPAHLTALVSNVGDVAMNMATNTEGTLAVYFRPNPELFSPTAGFFYSKAANGFVRNPPTDFSRYSPADLERVGWYYIPINNKRATWLSPYLNKNINEWMISYVVPIYAEGQPIGVVGMDISFHLLTRIVDSTHVYRTGYACLTTADGRVVYHKDLPMNTALANSTNAELNTLADRLLNRSDPANLFAYTYKGEQKRMTFQDLHNGLKFVITAPVAEINAQADTLFRQITLFSLAILLVSCVGVVIFTARLVNPLRELNVAAQKIASGDLHVQINHRSGDELGMLAESFRQTMCKLQEYINHINGLAYRDGLTGCKNKTAYLEAEARVNEQIRTGRPSFCVVVFDLNNLKVVNDTRGHDFGDMMIINSARLICRVFKHSPVFRIGGDEFVALLETADMENYVELLRQFEEEMADWNVRAGEGDVQVSIARGFAVYNEDVDMSFHNVFKRADDAMYLNKAEMKKG